MTTLSGAQIAKLLGGQYKIPSAVLGCHPFHRDRVKGQVVRWFNPSARSATVVRKGAPRRKMTKTHDAGLFEAEFAAEDKVADYRIEMTDGEGRRQMLEDAYNSKFGSLLTDFDIFLFAKGEHWKIHEKLGGRLATNAGVPGVHFAVWAPCARGVSVTGTFNHWNLKSHPMNFTRKNGIWELFIPGLEEGALYKFVIRTEQGKTLVKADPFAYAGQLRPKKSSIVRDLGRFAWTDSAWMEKRVAERYYDRPMSVYEVHLGSWIRKEDSENPFHNYREIAEDLIPYIKDLGFTHIELMPVMEHPLDESWGYQVTSYYAPTSRFGLPDDFMFFVNKCHEEGIGVILDWVPAHFPRDPHGLGRFDGSHLFEHADPRLGFHPDWKTNIFNFGRYEVRNFLLANALFWLEKYHIDGLRIDAVASMLYLDYSRKQGEWIPNKYGGNENLEAISFLRDLNRLVEEQHPGVMTIAEESTAWSGVSRPWYAGGLGFSYKWNMGWMHDSLEYMQKNPLFRKYHHNKLTFMLHYAFREKFSLVLSHDEVVHGKRSLLRKMPGERTSLFANLRLLYGFMYAHPGKKLLFMGSEFAQWREWAVNRELDWYLLDQPDHQRIQEYVRDLNALYRSNPALHATETHWKHFNWIDNKDVDNCVLLFTREDLAGGQLLLFAFNFSGRPLEEYRVGVPREGFYREILNANAEVYGGTDEGNHPGALSRKGPDVHGLPHHIELRLPALSMAVFRHEGVA